MDKKIAGLLGAAAALSAMTTAAEAMPAQTQGLATPVTYADLLAPVPNAVAALKADDARLIRVDDKKIIIKKKKSHHHHHHHHHHHD
jgi:hypothetical protein